MPVTNLRFNITSSWDGGGARSAARGLRDVDNQTVRLNRSMGRGARGLRLWQKAAIALSPALFTLGKSALALGGGLATLGIVTGAAIAPFIGLAITAAKNADGMGKAGAAYEKATGRVKNAWMDLARRTAPLTLQPMTDVLNGVAKAIPKLEPLVRDIAPVFADMGRSIGSWMAGRGFERFLQNVRDYGVPAFRNLVAAGRDFLATTGIGFRHFLPLALDISEAIRRGAGNMRDWAEGGGFARFLRDVRAEWPTVRRFLQEARESLGNIGQVLDSAGPGQLNLLGDVLEKFNEVDIDDWREFLITLGALKVAGGLASLIGGLLALRGARLSIAGGAALAGAAAALTAAGGILNGAAAALSAAAAALSSAGASAGLGGLLGGVLGGLGARLAGGSATFTVTIQPADAATRLAQIRDIINGLQGRTVTFTVTLNASGFTSGASSVLSNWAGIKAAAAAPAIFRAMAIPGNVPFVATSLIAAWARVRAAAALPVVFRASASAGNVVAVANSLVAAWSRVRAAAAVRPVFTATATAGNVPAVANQIVAAWNRVRAAAAIRPVFTAVVVPGPAIAGSAAIVAAWMRVLAMPRSWSASATASNGVSGPAGAARAAWSAVLAMPRSVTFTVNIVTKKTGNAEGGYPIPVPHLAGGGRAWPNGGLVRGRGGPTSDRIPAMLSRSEFVIRAAAVKELGTDFLSWINSAGSTNRIAAPSKGSGKGAAMGKGFSGGGRGSGDTHVHFHGKVYAMGDLDFQEMVVHATSEARRRGRL